MSKASFKGFVVIFVNPSKSLTLILERTRHVETLSNAVAKIKLVIVENSLGQGQSTLPSSGLFHVSSSLQGFFSSNLILVEFRKIIYNNWNGKGNDEDPADTADKANALAKEC